MADRNQFADAVERWEPDMKPRRPQGRPLHATDASGTLAPYQPTLRERVADTLAQWTGNDTRQGVAAAKAAMIDPFTGMYQAGRSGAEGDLGTAAIEGLSSMPGVGKAAAPLSKAVLIGMGGLAIDKKALAKAQAMAWRKAPADDIWQATRWEEVLPNQWLTEIPDTLGAYATPPQGTQALGGFYQEPGFYANYPEFANMRYKRLYSGPEHGGQYDFADPTIAINPKRTKEQQRDTFYHELMHGMQHKEYWPSGSSPERAASQMTPGSPGWELFVNKLDEMRKNPMSWDQFSDQFENATKEQYGRYLEDAKRTDLDWDNPLVNIAQKMAAFESYRRDPGEWLARIAGQRAGMSELNKGLVRPGRSADLPVSLVHPAGVPRKWVAPKAPPKDWPY